MEVYSKDNNTNESFLRLFAITVFTVFPLWYVCEIFKTGSLEMILMRYGNILPFVILFLILDCYFVFYMIKPSKPYKAKLLKKEFEMYEGEQITNMVFKLEYKKKPYEINPTEIRCYSKGKNKLKINEYYSLSMKEFSWRPKYVQNLLTNKSSNKKIFSLLDVLILTVFLELLLCVYGIVRYPKYIQTYICIAIFWGIILYKMLDIKSKK